MRRRLEDAAADLVVAAVRAHGNRRLAEKIQAGEFVLLVDDANEVSFVPSALAAFADARPEPPPDALGEPWGRLEGRRWRPSLQAAVRIGASDPTHRVILGEAAVQPFLYGKNVLRRSIKRMDNGLRPGDTAWVCSPGGEVLGLAKVLPQGRGEEALEPIVDLGWYLREGG